MDTQQFLAEFGHIASAPEGVQRLREMINVLSVQGKLVPQRTTDKSATDLLKRVSKEKANLISQGIIKRERVQSTLVDNFPQNYPDGWIEVHLSDVAWAQPGFAFKSSLFNDKECGLPLIRVRDVGSNAPRTFYSGEHREEFLVTAGDWLVAMDGDFRVAQWCGPTALLNQRVTRLVFFSEDIEARYICIALQLELRKLQGIKAYTTVDHLSAGQISASIIPLPPAKEQKRIVAKVEELMALCDKLEAQQQERQKLMKLLRATTLDSFVSTTNLSELKQSWIRIQNGLHYWGSDDQTPFELRNAIGAIACRGLLTDSGAMQPVINNNSLPPLPDGWHWQTLGDLSLYITSGSRGWKQYLAFSGDIFIRSQDIKHDALVLEDPAYVLLPEKTEGKRTLVQTGDLLLTITGANVGKCAQVPNLPKPAYVSQHVALIRVREPEGTPFIHFWMTNIYGGRRFLGCYIYGDKPGLNLTQVASVPVPMPPKEIQAQIVGSLEKFADICNRLFQQITEARETAKGLATAAVAAITGIRTEEDEELKAPKTELISNLRLGDSPGIKEQAPLAAILARQNGEMHAKDLWQRFGGEIDAFYAQLKLEVGKGWIREPEEAVMRIQERA